MNPGDEFDRLPAPAAPGIVSGIKPGTGHYAITRLLDETSLRRVADEARACCITQGVPYRNSNIAPDGQEGYPDGCVEVVEGGPLLHAFVLSPVVADVLQRLTGQRWVPRRSLKPSGRYSYSCYRQGYYFGLHRDVTAVELTALTCIDDQPGEGGDLLLYPGRLAEPLSAIRAMPDQGCVRLRLQPGQTLVMYGCGIAHALTPLGPGRTRIMAPVGYQRAA